MSKVTITFVDPSADERAFKGVDVRFMQVQGEITVKGSFIGFYDKKNNGMRYMSAYQILQVDEVLDDQDRLLAIKNKDEGKHKKAVIYYYKQDAEPEDDYVHRVSHPGKRPYGFEGYINIISAWWVSFFNPSMTHKIIVPSWIVRGVEEYG